MAGDARIPTSLRNLLIIETIARKGQPMTPTEIGHEIGLPKQTVHRLCNDLIDQGFLTREPNGRSLLPGSRLRGIGSGVLHTSWSHIARRQILVRVAAEVEETVNFVVPGNGGMRYVDRVETNWPIRVQMPVGTEVPFHCTASGKSFLATLPLSKRRTFIGALNLQTFTPNTLDDPGRLLEDTIRTAERGYALDEGEFIEEMNAICVPVTDSHHRYIASLAFHGPKQRLPIETAIRRVESIRRGAQALRQVLLT